jgi:feruloyl esterase
MNIPIRSLVALCAVAALAACNDDDDGAAPERTAQQQCEALASAAIASTTLTATYNADAAVTVGGAALPAHCVVEGKTNARTGVDGKSYAIGFRLRLPDTWNGRFLFNGGGGNDGTLGDAVGPPVGPITALVPAVSQGYAVVSTDGGHTGTSASDFGTDPLARIDHAYNAYDKTAVNAKALIAARYGRGPDKSYFLGGSGGGRQGMMFTQRFPTYFDGVVARYPAMRVASGATVAAMFNHITFTNIAPLDGGAPILSKAYSNADLTLLANGILAQCDALDGVADGMVNNFKACHFDISALQCTGAKTDTCLSTAQVGAMTKLFDGPRNTAGERLYTGQVTDPGIDRAGWRAWALGSSTTATPDSRYVTLMSDALKWEFFTPPAPDFDIMKFNFDTDPLRMAATSSVYDTYADATLAAYKAHGGKLMFVHGLADPIFNAHDTADYYERLAANNGGMAAVQAFARFFTVPGGVHGNGGRSTDLQDLLTPMVDWVEKGIAPDAIVAGAPANHDLFPNRTRPLCPYPKYAKYNGSGNVELAASFSCAE